MTKPVPPRRGDESDLYARHHARLQRAVARAVTAPAETIEDACSFAWLQLLRCQPERETAFAWLRTVAIREAIRLARREQRDTPLHDRDWPTDSTNALSPTAKLTDQLHAREALSAVAALPVRRERIFALHLAGHSYEEITAQLGEGPRAIDRQIRKARHRLRAQLG